jgi:hypothetical protein
MEEYVGCVKELKIISHFHIKNKMFHDSWAASLPHRGHIMLRDLLAQKCTHKKGY